MLEEHISSRLLWTDSDSVVCDDCTRGWRHLELLGGKLKDCREGGRLRDTQSASERGIRSSGDDAMPELFTHTLNGSFGSDVRVILKVTFEALKMNIFLYNQSFGIQ